MSVFPAYHSCWFSLILIKIVKLVFLLDLILDLLLLVRTMDSPLTMLAHRNVLLIWVSRAVTRGHILLLHFHVLVLTGDRIKTSNLAVVGDHSSRFAEELHISVLIVFTLIPIILSFHHNFVLSATFEYSLGTSHQHVLFTDVV